MLSRGNESLKQGFKAPTVGSPDLQSIVGHAICVDWKIGALEAKPSLAMIQLQKWDNLRPIIRYNTKNAR
jgi:hypothetical protein